jgi:GGDEF domain-containing protein
MVVADAFDAMTTNRIYKARKSLEEALVELKKFSGTQFHPEVAMAAAEALRDVSIGDTTQMPDNELEQRRFAYFFLDSMTDLYNDNYLKTLMIKREDERRCLYLVELKRFAEYNGRHGWDEGNRFLKSMAEALQAKYPQAMIFRYHGDNFILLFTEHHDVSDSWFKTLLFFEKSGVEVQLTHFDLKEGIPDL